MQFRIRTLFVVVTLLALGLAVSGRSEPMRRLELLLAIAFVSLGCGFLAQSLRAIRPPIRAAKLFWVLLSIVGTSAALGATVLVTALVLQDQFQGPPAPP